MSTAIYLSPRKHGFDSRRARQTRTWLAIQYGLLCRPRLRPGVLPRGGIEILRTVFGVGKEFILSYAIV
jgi:hypothetical protein